MSSELARLLVNVLFILIPIFALQIFWIDKDKGNSDLKMPSFTILLSLSTILCMSFPLEFFPNFFFDLRQVPFIIGALYGGYRIGGWIFLSILAYRLTIGGDGIYVNFIVITLIIACVPLLTAAFKTFKLKHKILLSVGIAETTAIMTIFLPHLFTQNTIEYTSISLNYFIIQGLSIALIVYLLETMLKNYQIRKELSKAEKMSVISHISASISHELKNPITITQGFVEALEDEDNKENRKEYIQFALDELQRAQKIIYEFLALTKPELETVKIVNLSQELDYVTNLMKPYAKTNAVKIRVEKEEEDCLILGDQQKIRQCFINIVKNAIEAMDNGGDLQLNAQKNHNKIIIDIIDNGVGMTTQEINQLGTPYFTTKEEGTGLGMMIVFNIIKKMKGEIKIKSQKGKGTHFTISFPIAS